MYIILCRIIDRTVETICERSTVRVLTVDYLSERLGLYISKTRSYHKSEPRQLNIIITHTNGTRD